MKKVFPFLMVLAVLGVVLAGCSSPAPDTSGPAKGAPDKGAPAPADAK